MSESAGDSENGGNRASAQRVLIRGLEVRARVGVPDEERAEAQRLLIDLEIESETRFEDLDDDIALAVDYDALTRRVRAAAESGERRLIETLVADVAEVALEDEKVSRATVRIRKFILPDTEFVGVELTRSRGEGEAGP